MVRIFFSYSHRDEEFRNELEIHLAPLKREGIISTWHDRRIGAGEDFTDEISEELETADIILLLISPYFIASDYCHDVEMTRAMERHKQGDARVIPVILHPCDWHSMAFGKLLAVPIDGKPISKFPNIHEGFLQVTQAIRKAAEEIDGATLYQSATAGMVTRKTALATTQPQIRSSNLRVKRTFSDRDKDLFREETFEYIANFFEGSLAELQERNPGVEAWFRRIDANHFTAVAYYEGTRTAECRIWMGSKNMFGGDIVFSHQITSDDNSFNESLHIENDGYTLFLRPMGMSLIGEPGPTQLTQQGASEFLWNMFIREMQ